MKINKILLEEWKQGRLKGLYLLTLPTMIEKSEASLQFKEWSLQFTAECLVSHYSNTTVAQMRNRLLLGHPDFLLISSSEDKKAYLQEDFAELFTFLSHRPYEWPHRFIIIEEIHLISESMVNKLLKTFESLPSDVTLFLLHTTAQKLLPTLESRAITIQIALTPQKTSVENIALAYSYEQRSLWWKRKLKEERAYSFSDEFIDLLIEWVEKKNHFQPLLELFRSAPKVERELYRLIIDWELSHDSSYLQKQGLLTTLQEVETSWNYHNWSKERAARLLEACHLY